eukprot:119567_1
MQLNDFLMRYEAQLNGVVLSYSNVKIRDSLRTLLFERPYVAVQVGVEFVVLVLKEGSVLVGHVTKLGDGYVGLVTAGALPVKIPREIMFPEYKFAQSQSSWVGDGSQIHVGAQVRFSVVKPPAKVYLKA